MDIASDLGLLLELKRVFTRPIDRIANASDASFCRLIPQAVTHPHSVPEMKKLFDYSQPKKIPLVFHTAGTGLLGQSVTDRSSVNLSKYSGKIRVENEGEFIRLRPGVVGAHADRTLRLYRRRIGHDPASIDACIIGGILSNGTLGFIAEVVLRTFLAYERKYTGLRYFLRLILYLPTSGWNAAPR